MRGVAFLRGIAPSVPNMRNEKLRDVFEALGFSQVETVISSGNVIFRTRLRSARAVEDLVEPAWPERLRFTSTTIVRTQEELRDLVEARPFGSLPDEPTARLNVTFLKHDPPQDAELPASGAGYEVLGVHGKAVLFVVDSTAQKTPEVMAQVERAFGKEISTRTWRTVEKVRARLEHV